MTNLIFDECMSSPELIDHINSITWCLREYQSQLTGVKPPQASQKLTYDALIKQFESVRIGSLWYPYIGTGLGNGALVELADGSVKYDMISGIGSHFSHGHPKLIEARLKGALQNMTMQGNLQQNRESEQLLSRFCEISGMDVGVLTTSGVMAVENALKIAFQAQFPKKRVLAFEGCFAGRTLSVAQLTDKPQYREGLPPTLLVDYIPFYDESDPVGSTKRAVDTLKSHLSRYPDQYAVMCMELIQGEGGYYPGHTHFFNKLIDILKVNNILVFVDEIQTFGRTTAYFAYQEFELADSVDLVTVGKLSQVCATLLRYELTPRPGLISQTFTGATSAIQSALVILDEMADGYLGENGKINQIRTRFLEHFNEMALVFGDQFQGPYGCGGMIAFTPFEGDRDRVIQLVHWLFEAGVIGFICGKSPVRVRLLPPMGGMTVEVVDEVMTIIKQVMRDVGA